MWYQLMAREIGCRSKMTIFASGKNYFMRQATNGEAMYSGVASKRILAIDSCGVDSRHSVVLQPTGAQPCTYDVT